MPDRYTVIDCEQRSEAWFAARAGLVTATDAADLLAKPLKSGGEPACRRDLRMRIVTERLTNQPADEDGYVSAEMRRGMELEDEARGAFEAATGLLVLPVGFLRHNDLPIGCSPDGLIGDDCGVELKVPKSATHLRYWRSGGKVPSEHYAQVLHTLFVTGAESWWFASYDPRFPAPLQLYIVRVVAADFAPGTFDEYDSKLRAFFREVDSELADVRNLLAASGR